MILRPSTYSPSVSIVRATGPTASTYLPPRSSATRGSSQGRNLYASIVGTLFLASTAVALYDLSLLVSLWAG